MGTARSTALLLWAQLLSLVGSQPPLLTMDPPWTPQFVGQSVKLTCGEPSVSSSSTWYVDGQRWTETPSNHLHVELSGKRKYSFQCRTRGSELSSAVDLTASNDWLVLQVPTQAVMEGDSLSLRCSAWKDKKLSQVKFFHDRKLLQERRENELLLSPAEQQHSGSYHCSAYVYSFIRRQESAQTDLVVQELFSVPKLSLQGPQEPPEGSALTLLCSTHGNALRPHVSLQHLFYQDGRLVGGPQSAPQHQMPVLLLSHSGSYSCQVQTETGSVRKHSAPHHHHCEKDSRRRGFPALRSPDAQVLLGDRVLLSCAVSVGSGPLSFSWHRQNRTGALGSGPLYELRAAQLEDDDRYHCTASNGISTASSPPLRLAVTLPVSNASIAVLGTEVGAELERMAGEELNLSCRVGAGTGPVGFVWLRDGQELSRGPTWHLGVLGPQHAGIYQCVAANSLGTRRVFRARSPEVLLVVTPQGWGRAAGASPGCRAPRVPPGAAGRRCSRSDGTSGGGGAAQPPRGSTGVRSTRPSPPAPSGSSVPYPRCPFA
ncbi:LOW QUALITY PROTEIN: Fc receptor-like protein 3, partial [Lagopus muta]|uniref:LOW QUALITY PROTEIN: Fc receptor-like protein 3 n=1 Tax=Lagopus muta TaxID=64668 RepID=UPI0020A01720